MPSDFHCKLKKRAAKEGLSVSDYLLRESLHGTSRLSLDEIRKRLATRQPVNPRLSAAAAVRNEREGRDL